MFCCLGGVQGANHKIYVRTCAMVADLDKFDAAFFKIPPNDAVALDPQQRMLMEQSWHALEDACVSPHRVPHHMAAYVGLTINEHRLSDPYFTSTIAIKTSANALAAARLAYFYDFRGDAACVDTACSSSFFAFHLAVRRCRPARSGAVLTCGFH